MKIVHTYKWVTFWGWFLQTGALKRNGGNFFWGFLSVRQTYLYNRHSRSVLPPFQDFLTQNFILNDILLILKIQGIIFLLRDKDSNIYLMRKLRVFFQFFKTVEIYTQINSTLKILKFLLGWFHLEENPRSNRYTHWTRLHLRI